MIECNECKFAEPYKDVFLGKEGYRCSKMLMIDNYGNEYSLQNTGCVEGIRKGDCPSIQTKVQNSRLK